jgi:hypothetical protein
MDDAMAQYFSFLWTPTIINYHATLAHATLFEFETSLLAWKMYSPL